MPKTNYGFICHLKQDYSCWSAGCSNSAKHPQVFHQCDNIDQKQVSHKRIRLRNKTIVCDFHCSFQLNCCARRFKEKCEKAQPMRAMHLLRQKQNTQTQLSMEERLYKHHASKSEQPRPKQKNSPAFSAPMKVDSLGKALTHESMQWNAETGQPKVNP